MDTSDSLGQSGDPVARVPEEASVSVAAGKPPARPTIMGRISRTFSLSSQNVEGSKTGGLNLSQRVRKAFRRTQEPDLDWPSENHETLTSDGWRIALKNYLPFKDVPTMPRPVLLLHGISGNHHMWDYQGETSLVWALCAKGYSVWLIDLRCSGDSEKMSKSKKPINWGLGGYVKDVKAGIDYVLAHEGTKDLHLIGHSLGGILGLMVIAGYPDVASKVASLAALASSLHYGSSDWRKLKPIVLPMENLVDFVNLQTVMKVYAPFVVWPSFLAHMTNVKRPELLRLMHKVENVPMKVLTDLATAERETGLEFDFGDGPRPVQDLLPRVTAPVLLMAGDYDRQCKVLDVHLTMKHLTSAPKRLVVVGPKPAHEHHCGHIDIVVGKNVHKEVFPYIFEFLHAADSGQSVDAGVGPGTEETGASGSAFGESCELPIDWEGHQDPQGERDEQLALAEGLVETEEDKEAREESEADYQRVMDIVEKSPALRQVLSETQRGQGGGSGAEGQ